MSRHRVLSWVFIGLLIASAPSLASADIIANFTGGNGTASVDQYQGTAGSGWSTAWKAIVGGTFTATNTVVSANPLNSSGNYLSVSLTNNANLQWAPYACWSAFRQYENNGNVSLTSDHVLQFDYRVDSLPTGWGTSQQDRIEIFDNSYNTLGGDQPWLDETSSWFATALGTVTANTSLSGKWLFGDFDGSDTTWNWNTKIVNSGIAVEANKVYSFTISLHPTTDTYDVAVTDGTNSFSATDLGFRNDAGPTGKLNWAMRLSDTGDTGAFSLDSVNISTIPEPASLTILVTAVLGLICYAWRKRR